MTKNSRLAQLDREKSALMAQIAKSQREGRSDPSLLSRVRKLSSERVELAVA